VEAIAAAPANCGDFIALDDRNNTVWMFAGTVHLFDVSEDCYRRVAVADWFFAPITFSVGLFHVRLSWLLFGGLTFGVNLYFNDLSFSEDVKAFGSFQNFLLLHNTSPFLAVMCNTLDQRLVLPALDVAFYLKAFR
jgi:hypothetical protein